MRWFALAAFPLLLADGGGNARFERPLTRALFTLAREANPRADDGDPLASWRALEQIASEVRGDLRNRPAESPASVLNTVIYRRFAFVREIDDKSLDYVLLPSVLRHHRGSCVGLGTLYMALGEALGWKIEGRLLPGHLYVRIAERDAWRNVELLREGEAMPAAWYRERYPIAGESAPEYERALSLDEVLGVVEYDIAHERERASQLLEAEHYYRRACQHFPDFAEAHASLAVLAHLLGDLELARSAYVEAYRANPHLPGLIRNLDLLERAPR